MGTPGNTPTETATATKASKATSPRQTVASMLQQAAELVEQNLENGDADDSGNSTFACW